MVITTLLASHPPTLGWYERQSQGVGAPFLYAHNYKHIYKTAQSYYPLSLRNSNELLPPLPFAGEGKVARAQTQAFFSFNAQSFTRAQLYQSALALVNPSPFVPLSFAREDGAVP